QLAALVAGYWVPGSGTMYRSGVRNTNGTFTAEIWAIVGTSQTHLANITLTSAQFNGTGTIGFEVVNGAQRLFVNGKLVALGSDTDRKSVVKGKRAARGGQRTR